jgi:MFS family permease
MWIRVFPGNGHRTYFMKRDTVITRGRASLQILLRALRYRNFRLFFMGQGISLIGTWMQQIALSWLVYRMTGSAFLLGIVGFCAQIPAFLLSPLAGVLADRVRKQRLLMCTQTMAMLQAFALAVLVLTGSIRIWHIIAASIFIGMVNAFDIPTRHSFYVEMIEKKEDLANAIALNSSMFNGARLIGPAIAGALIAVLGEGLCFLINAISYLAVLWALAIMRLKPTGKATRRRPVLHELREGFSYAIGFKPIRILLMMLALLSLAGMPYTVLMPVFAGKVLNGGVHTYGFLMTASGVGAFVSAVFLASRKTVLGLGRIIAIASTLFGIALITFSLSRNILLSLIILCIAGFAAITQVAACNTILQTITDDDKRGRVMSFYTMSFMGMAPFGSLLAGFLAGHMGAPNTVLLGGISCMAGSIFFFLKLPSIRGMVRPLYMRMGILPEVAKGIQTATEAAIEGEREKGRQRFSG